MRPSFCGQAGYKSVTHRQRRHRIVVGQRILDDCLPGSHATCEDSHTSLWHCVDLYVNQHGGGSSGKQGMFHGVTEVRLGSLRKFEVQTKLPFNVIREDIDASRKLRAFGQPVPFNYGCFPQTFRDPNEVDELHGAPGDGDPLDVIDLCHQRSDVGQIVCYRPLGAFCVIDEGRADWKIIAVNALACEPLAKACTLCEVNQIQPGRVQQVISWFDAFKQHAKTAKTWLHHELHGRAQALSIIDRDHKAWLRLVSEACSDGECWTARGYWIHEPGHLQRRLRFTTMPFA